MAHGDANILGAIIEALAHVNNLVDKLGKLERLNPTSDLANAQAYLGGVSRVLKADENSLSSNPGISFPDISFKDRLFKEGYDNTTEKGKSDPENPDPTYSR